MPGPGGYWFWPPRSASTAAASISGGPSVSGKPCPRLTAPVRTARADISAKIVVPNGRIRCTPTSKAVVTKVSLAREDELGAGRGGEVARSGLLGHFLAADGEAAVDGAVRPEATGRGDGRQGRAVLKGQLQPP